MRNDYEAFYRNNVFIQYVVLYGNYRPTPHLQEIYQFKGWKERVYLGGRGLLNPGDINNDGYDEYISYHPNNDSAIFFWGAYPVDTIPDVVFFEKRAGGFNKNFSEAILTNVDANSLTELIIPFWSNNQPVFISCKWEWTASRI